MSLLFQPIQFGHLTLSNRIVIAPMCQYSAQGDGEVQFWHQQQWANFALSGAGLCIIEATAVQAEGRISYADLGLWNDSQAEKIKASLDQIRQYSPMPFAVQLAHAGRKASVEKPWLGNAQISPEQENGWQTVSASQLAFQPQQHAPEELSQAEIQQLQADFAQAAQRAVYAGFALVELHAAHGYLLHQFLSPLSNARQDCYGGSLENRMRMTLETFDAVKAAVPEDYPVGVRLSATDWVEGGWTLEETIVLSQALAARGVAYLHISTAGLDARQEIPIAPLYQVPFAAAVKAAVDVPVIAVGLITTPEQAEQILEQNEADAIGIARAILYQPRWPWQAAAALGDQIEIAPQYLRCQPRESSSLFKAYSAAEK